MPARRNAHTPGPVRRGRIDPDHRAHFENARSPQHLDHEVRADVSEQNGYFGFAYVSVYSGRIKKTANEIARLP